MQNLARRIVRHISRCSRHALLLAAVVASPTMAERQRPLAQVQAEPAGTARVIVAYRAESAVARAHPVQRGSPRADVALALQGRANTLGQRAGVALRTGRAVGERAHVVMASGVGSAALAARLALDPDVAYAVVDRRRRALAVNDPLFSAGPASGKGPDVGQWYLRAPTDLFKSGVNVQPVWDVGVTGTGIVVAVIDTGAWYDHVDLSGRLLNGYDVITDSATANDGGGRDANAADPGDWCATDSSDSSWHGTQMAGIIGALTNNGVGMAGIAHGAKVMPVRALGKCGGFDSDIAAGMLWAAGIDQPGLRGSTTPARVLNLSLGGASGDPCSQVYLDAVGAVTAKGAVTVVAAGNSAGRAVGAPANCPGVIAVAGLRHAGSKVGFSDLGPEIAIAAPGGNCVNLGAGEACLYPILTTSNSGTRGPNAGGSVYTDSFDISVGTSYSTPIVSGTVALMLSAKPQLTPAEVKQALQSSARPFPTTGGDNGPDDPTPVTTCQAPMFADQLQCYCTTALCGAGMLDAAAAVNAVTGGLYARIEVSPAAAVAGTEVSLSSASSLAGTGRSIVSTQWLLVNGGGAVTAFTGASNAATAALLPAAAGTVLVRLTVVDDVGVQSSVDRSIVVAAAPVVPVVPVDPPAAGGGGGGGGAFSAVWILLLAFASGVLLHSRRRMKRCKR